MPSGKKKKRHKMSTHKRKKRLRKNRHKSKYPFVVCLDNKNKEQTWRSNIRLSGLFFV